MEDKKEKQKSSILWRLLRWGLIGLAGLVTLIGLLWAEENWRGKRAWENYKHEWEAKGAKFDIKDFIPPTVPDEENFTMTPFLAPVFDFAPSQKPGERRRRDTNAFEKTESFGNDRGSVNHAGSWQQGQRTDLKAWATALETGKDASATGETPAERAAAAAVVLQEMKKYEQVLEELKTASKRPYFRFNVGYTEEPMLILLPHLAITKKLSVLYSLRASAELADGQAEAALSDIKMTFYLASGVKDEPFLISGLVGIAAIDLGLHPIWEGLADHKWTEAQAKEVQEMLMKFDLLADYEHTMRGELAFDDAELEYQRKSKRITMNNAAGALNSMPNFIPSGWFYQNEVALNQLGLEVLLPTVDAAAHRVQLESAKNTPAKADELLSHRPFLYVVLARSVFAAVDKSISKYARVQVGLDEAVIACALERYRLAHGEYPEKLEALSPQFLEKVPMDVITGEPLKYRRRDAGHFVLYSVGWNGVDDGGKVVMGKGTTPGVDYSQGDWVWAN